VVIPEGCNRKPQASPHVFQIQIRKLVNDLLCCQAAGEEVQYVVDANPHAADARTPATLLRIYGDALRDKGHLSISE
jgi:hypothetical protein